MIKNEININGNFPIFDIIEIYLKYIEQCQDKYKKNMKVNLMIIEISIKKRQKNLSTKNFQNQQNVRVYKWIVF